MVKSLLFLDFMLFTRKLDTRQIQGFKDSGIKKLKSESFPYVNPSIRNFSISSGKYFGMPHSWIPAFAGMTM